MEASEKISELENRIAELEANLASKSGDLLREIPSTNPNQKRIDELRKRISDIYRRKTGRHTTNPADAIPMIQAEIRRLGGNPYVYAPKIG